MQVACACTAALYVHLTYERSPDSTQSYKGSVQYAAAPELRILNVFSRRFLKRSEPGEILQCIVFLMIVNRFTHAILRTPSRVKSETIDDADSPPFSVCSSISVPSQCGIRLQVHVQHNEQQKQQSSLDIPLGTPINHLKT